MSTDLPAGLDDFLNSAGWGGAEVEPLPGDASFRRYFRVRHEGRGAMLMDAPPPNEDPRPFLSVGSWLIEHGLRAPLIYAQRPEAGLVLLEDFGNDRMRDWLDENPAAEARVYSVAVEALAELHRQPPGPFEPYDMAVYLREALLFTEWFCPAAGIDASTITIENIGFPVREPMLASGDVDGVFGFAFSVILNLIANGVPEDDISTILFADHGLNLYGNAILVNEAFAAENPEAVKGFLRALTKGFADAVADPAAGAAAVLARNETLNLDTETARLTMANEMNIKTPYVIENGFGDVDEARLTASLETLKLSMGLKGNVTAADVFDAQYLPPVAERMLP